MVTTEAASGAAFSARAIFDRLVHVETRLWNLCDDALRKQSGLPFGRLEVLRIIAVIDQCRVGDIAIHLHITVGAVSKLVDRLEASGHCRRQPNPGDRRSSVLSVTGAGEAALAQAEAILEPLLQRYLGVANHDHLSDALKPVEQALENGTELEHSAGEELP